VGTIRQLLGELVSAEPSTRDHAQIALARWSRAELAVVERALATAACADTHVMREAAAMGVAIAMEACSCFERTRLMSEWTMSANRWHRLAIARALCDPVYTLGASAAVERLSVDPYRAVRSAAVAAAASRLVQQPREYCRIIQARAADSSRWVRQQAISALQAAAELGSIEAVDVLGECAVADDPDTATHAVDALAAVVNRDPTRIMLALARVTDHAEERDPRVLDRLIEDIRQVASYAPEAASRVLHRLEHHKEWWLRDQARLAALRADELS